MEMPDNPAELSGNAMTISTDKRTRRTRAALVRAFNELVLEGADGEIRVVDVIRRADVGRSTFYEHYSSAEDIHMQALAAPMSVLADALSGTRDPGSLKCLLDHFWDLRCRARKTFTATKTRDRIARFLADQVHERLEAESGGSPDVMLVARQLAESALGLVRAWLAGEVVCSSRSLADAIVKSSDLIVQGFPEARV